LVSHRLISLLSALLKEPEREWLEFKHNFADPKAIGEYISALSNSACLNAHTMAYMVWGVEDGTRNVVGTHFDPVSEKVGNQPFEMWLNTKLTPRVNFQFHEFMYGAFRMILLTIKPVAHMPVRFEDLEFIRVGSSKTRLRDNPEKEKELWRISELHKIEEQSIMFRLTDDVVLDLLDYPAYFQLSGQPLPQNKAAILKRLEQDRLIAEQDDGTYDITMLGGLLFARDLKNFDAIARKAVRVIIYKGRNRIETIRERVWSSGYAAGFVGLISFINEQLPTNELIGQALRTEKRMYPEIAIRELVANAIIHQNLAISGTSPTVEMFQDRIEIANPGVPLIDTLRLMDNPPHSRNELMATLMRRLNICEERGSGIDKVVFNVEMFQLPAPEFLVYDDHLKATLYAYRKFGEMSKSDKIRACYQHACLQWVSNQQMTNASLRQRFGIADKNYATASRIISDAVEAKYVKLYDPDSNSRRNTSYVPFWA